MKMKMKMKHLKKLKINENNLVGQKILMNLIQVFLQIVVTYIIGIKTQNEYTTTYEISKENFSDSIINLKKGLNEIMMHFNSKEDIIFFKYKYYKLTLFHCLFRS